MMRGLGAIALLSLVGAASPQASPPATSQPVPPSSAPANTAATIAPAEEPIDPTLLATLELSPHDLRMAVPVRIAGNDEYRFVIDTGAERTVISRELADRLALGSGPAVQLVSLSGTSRVATVAIPDLRFVQKQEGRSVMAPALSYRHLGTSGLLGVDLLAGHRVTIDIDRKQMEVRPARKRSRPRPGPSEIVVTATSRLGQLIVTDADYRGQRIRVVIDTGSGITIGNMKMRELIGKRGRTLGTLAVTSVTGKTVSAEYHQVDTFRVGGLNFTNQPVAFADLAPFATLGLDDTPAMLLGMDAFRMFRRVDIDFANRDIAFELRPQDGIAIRQL